MGNTHYYSGALDEIRIYSRSLTDSVIQELYNSEKPVGIDNNNSIIPDAFILRQNYPNPFNPSTTIKYQIPELSFVILKVYDVLGNEIVILVNEEKSVGSYDVEFNGTELVSGIYFYRLQAGEFVATKKMVLLK